MEAWHEMLKSRPGIHDRKSDFIRRLFTRCYTEYPCELIRHVPYGKIWDVQDQQFLYVLPLHIRQVLT